MEAGFVLRSSVKSFGIFDHTTYCLFVCLFVCLLACLLVCLFVCLLFFVFFLKASYDIIFIQSYNISLYDLEAMLLGPFAFTLFPVFCFASLHVNCFQKFGTWAEQAQEVAPEIIGREELQQPTLTVDGCDDFRVDHSCQFQLNWA